MGDELYYADSLAYEGGEEAAAPYADAGQYDLNPEAGGAAAAYRKDDDFVPEQGVIATTYSDAAVYEPETAVDQLYPENDFVGLLNPEGSGAPAPAGAAPGAPPAARAIPERDYRTVGLLDAFDTEDDPDDPDNPWKGQPRNRTARLEDDELDPYKVTFDEQGRAWQNGRLLDTRDSGAPLSAGSKSGRDIFTADSDGDITSADMRDEFKRRPGARFHHSSLPDGGEIAAAGEIQARDGVVEVISDRSGHYRPDMGLTGQMVTSLEDRGARIEAVGVELGDKDDMPGGDIQASALEVQAYGEVTGAELARAAGQRAPGAPNDRADYARVGDEDMDEDEEEAAADAGQRGRQSERLLRERHGQKDNMLQELRDATAGRRLAADEGVEADELLPEAPPDFSTIGPLNRSAVAGMVARGAGDADKRISFMQSGGTVLLGEGHDFAVVKYLGPTAAGGFVTFKRNRMSANEFVVQQQRGDAADVDEIRVELVRHLNDDSVYDYGDVSRVKVHF